MHYANLQTYSGGFELKLEEFTKLGFQYQQLLYGMTPEHTPRSHSPDQVKIAYLNQDCGTPLAGIHIWRLNSHNLEYENRIQAMFYDFLHNTRSGGYDVIQDWRLGYWNEDQMKARVKQLKPN